MNHSILLTGATGSVGRRIWRPLEVMLFGPAYRHGGDHRHALAFSGMPRIIGRATSARPVRTGERGVAAPAGARKLLNIEKS